MAARMPSGPLTGWSIQISTGWPGFAGGVYGDAVELVEEHVVHIERAVQEGDAIDAIEHAILQEELGIGGAGGKLVDFAVGGVGDVERLIRSDREIVAGAVIARQIPADLWRAGGKIEAS